jgi:hypothetical protein
MGESFLRTPQGGEPFSFVEDRRSRTRDSLLTSKGRSQSFALTCSVPQGAAGGLAGGKRVSVWRDCFTLPLTPSHKGRENPACILLVCRLSQRSPTRVRQRDSEHPRLFTSYVLCRLCQLLPASGVNHPVHSKGGLVRLGRRGQISSPLMGED